MRKPIVKRKTVPPAYFGSCFVFLWCASLFQCKSTGRDKLLRCEFILFQAICYDKAFLSPDAVGKALLRHDCNMHSKCWYRYGTAAIVMKDSGNWLVPVVWRALQYGVWEQQLFPGDRIDGCWNLKSGCYRKRVFAIVLNKRF